MLLSLRAEEKSLRDLVHSLLSVDGESLPQYSVRRLMYLSASKHY